MTTHKGGLKRDERRLFITVSESVRHILLTMRGLMPYLGDTFRGLAKYGTELLVASNNREFLFWTVCYALRS